MTDKPTKEWIMKLPKTDLHCHLGGSIRIETILDLADKQKIKLPANHPDDLRPHVSVDGNCGNLSNYLKKIALAERVLASYEALDRAAYELVKDAAAENVIYLETRFGPTNYQKYGLKINTIVQSVIDGMKKAEKELNKGRAYNTFKTGLILCGIRTDKKATQLAAETAINFQNRGVVGFDLAGEEHGHRPKEFRDIFEIIHNNFLPVTVHAGESYGAKSIGEAIIHLNAIRIGHGTKLSENEKIHDYINTSRTGLEICPSSNVHTNCVSDFQTHPLPFFVADGLRVIICTDNRTTSNTTVTDEIYRCVQEFDFSKTVVKQLIRNGFKAAFMDPKTKRKYLDYLDEVFDAENNLSSKSK